HVNRLERGRTMKKLMAIVLLGVVLAGCAAKKPVVGSANQFDSDSYLTLVTAALNGLITAYDVANPVYVAYHNAALAGQATAAQQSAVTSSLGAVSTAT